MSLISIINSKVVNAKVKHAIALISLKQCKQHCYCFLFATQMLEIGNNCHKPLASGTQAKIEVHQSHTIQNSRYMAQLERQKGWKPINDQIAPESTFQVECSQHQQINQFKNNANDDTLIMISMAHCSKNKTAFSFSKIFYYDIFNTVLLTPYLQN